MKAKPLPDFGSPLEALDAGIAEADRREHGEFDGLLGNFDPLSSRLLREIVARLRDYLLDRYSDAEARELLKTFEPVPGYRNMPVVDDDVELAIGLLNLIRSAARCEPGRFAEWVLGKAGVQGKANSRVQSARAGNPRRDPDLIAIVKQLARREGTAKARWPALLARLDSDGYHPRETAGSEPRKWRIDYTDVDGRNRSVTLDTFARMLREYRTQ